MPFTSINSTIPRTNANNFHEKILKIGRAGKWVFFLRRPFCIFKSAILNFFCFISLKNAAHFYEVSFFSALWMVFPESWKRSCPNFYAHDCIWYNCLSLKFPCILLVFLDLSPYCMLIRDSRLFGTRIRVTRSLNYKLYLRSRKAWKVKRHVIRGRSQTTLTSFLYFSDHLPPLVDIFYLIKVGKKLSFLDYILTWLRLFQNILGHQFLWRVLPKSDLV